MFLKKLPLFLALALISTQVSAQTSEALPFVRIGHDASREAMAGAGTLSGASAAWASFDYAALSVESDSRLSAAAGYQNWTPSGTGYINAGLSLRLGERLGLTAGASYGIGKPYDVYSAAGAKTGTFTPGQYILNVGAAYKILPFLSAGVNVHSARETIAESQSHGTISGDVSLIGSFGGFKTGLGVLSVGTPVYSASGDVFNLPTSARISLAYEGKAGDSLAYGAYADADYYIFSSGINAAAGVRVEYNEFVRLMAGYNYGSAGAVIPSHASAGLGVTFAGISLDAAYLLASESLGGSLLVTLGYSF